MSDLSRAATRRDAAQHLVSVAELVARHRGRDVPAENTRISRLFVPQRFQCAGRPEEVPPAARSGRTRRRVATAAGLVLVCGVVMASVAALAGARMQRVMPAAAPGPASVAGADVLRPDLMSAAVAAAGAIGSGRAADRAGAVETAPGAGKPAVAEVGPDPGGLGEVLGQVLDPVRDPVLGTVTTFFQTVSTAPADAFGLLAPGMQGQGYPSFERSWTGVDHVTVDAVSRDGHDAALVRVTLRRADGSILRATARVVVGVGTERRIVDAMLLSATMS